MIVRAIVFEGSVPAWFLREGEFVGVLGAIHIDGGRALRPAIGDVLVRDAGGQIQMIGRRWPREC